MSMWQQMKCNKPLNTRSLGSLSSARQARQIQTSMTTRYVGEH